MKRTTIALFTVLAFTGAAVAQQPGASARTPGHEMQEKGSVRGSSGASGYAPGHEMKSGNTAGSTTTTKSGTREPTSGGTAPTRR